MFHVTVSWTWNCMLFIEPADYLAAIFKYSAQSTSGEWHVGNIGSRVFVINQNIIGQCWVSVARCWTDVGKLLVQTIMVAAAIGTFLADLSSVYTQQRDTSTLSHYLTDGGPTIINLWVDVYWSCVCILVCSWLEIILTIGGPVRYCGPEIGSQTLGILRSQSFLLLLYKLSSN